jgi:phage gp29-like protein
MSVLDDVAAFATRTAEAVRARTGRGPGRPRDIERDVTVASMGQLMSWPGPFSLRRGRAGYELTNPDELLLRQGFRTYREMLADDTVKACLAFKKVLVHQRDWEIEPVGGKDAGEKAKAHAAFVMDVLQETQWNRIMRETLSALDFGFSVGEILWEVKEWKDEGLKVVLRDIRHRDPEFLRADVDIHGNIIGFRQISGYHVPNRGVSTYPNNEIVIEPGKVIHFAYQSNFGNAYGVSDLRAAYRAWWSKKFVTQFWNVFLERFGSPLTAMKYPAGAAPELKAALQDILTSLSTRSDILVPEGVSVELIEATRGGAAGYAEALNYCDIGISRAILVPALLGMGVDVKRGSDSQSRLHLRVLMKIANDIATDLENIYTERVVKPLVDMNFPGVTDYPAFVFRDYGEYEAVEIVDSMINMFNAGMLDADQDDINYMRSILGAPLREEGDEDEVMRAPPPPVGTSPNDPNASGAGAAKNNNRATKGPATPGKVRSGANTTQKR